ncbi:putative 60S ribosomal protein L14 [Piromyces finnis]|uniref:Putative 60S ribosomal protein L14 n=1 Tax=Piromyces finnis TaxID=1754191 RepID=A0A1Y1UVK0_9FUNG|nr:putative 60S ribosomal protein L14 [Piromyces finnis]|eukprot:ORX41633.1 putative 60S ribosomal protein L14 [Piromyces finnis]
MVEFKKIVEVGRVVMITYGPDAGKLAVIVDIIDHARALIDGPTTNVARQAMSFKRLNLTAVKVANLPRGASSPVVAKRLADQKISEVFAKTTYAKKLAARAARANLTDFGRFKLMIAKKQRRNVINREFAKLKKQN